MNPTPVGSPTGPGSTPPPDGADPGRTGPVGSGPVGSAPDGRLSGGSAPAGTPPAATPPTESPPTESPPAGAGPNDRAGADPVTAAGPAAGPSAQPASAPEAAHTTGEAEPDRRSHFTVGLAAVAAVAAGIQALFIHAMSHRTALPAAGWYDTVQARLLVRGYWLVDPVRATSGTHLLVPTAAHPPLPTVLLAVADVVDATGPTAHMVFLAVLFVASVILAGVTVRDLVGERAGLLAALVMATFPLLWVNPATVGPETAVIAVTTLLLFASVRFWTSPRLAHAALVGLALGLCALTRTDLVALLVMIGIPLALLVRRASWPAKLRGLALMSVVFVLVVGPWVGRNLSLFGHGVVLSQDYGVAVAGANCVTTYSGSLEGWWSPGCASVPIAGVTRTVESVQTDDQVRAARTYISDHPGAAVTTAAARLGRMWDVYRPGQTARLEAVTGRPVWVSDAGRWYLYVLVPVALVGAVVLRRRQLLLFPFVSVIVLACLTCVLSFGDARFAVDADVALALLAGVGLDAGIAAATRRWSPGPGRHSAGRMVVT